MFLHNERVQFGIAGELFLEVVPVALLVPTKLPKNKLLRARFISYLHRMVECLGGQLLPMLPQTLAALLHRECDVWDLCSALRVVSQLVLKFPGDVAPLLKELMPSIIFKCAPCWPRLCEWLLIHSARVAGMGNHARLSKNVIYQAGFDFCAMSSCS